MRDRIFALVERELVLQAPSKNCHGQHQEAERKQHSATAIPRRIAKDQQACFPVHPAIAEYQPSANGQRIAESLGC
jgi:hypothetical protein